MKQCHLQENELSEINYTKKNKYHMFSLICRIWSLKNEFLYSKKCKHIQPECPCQQMSAFLSREGARVNKTEHGKILMQLAYLMTSA
jgi:hypothetical protein